MPGVTPFGRLAAPLAADTRRYDLDALRIGAIGLLILTHVTYVYRTEWWRVHCEHAGLWANILVDAMAPWRMSLVFFISGAATRFMLDRQSAGGFIAGRAMRLLLPFVVTIVVLAPTMMWMTQPEMRDMPYVDFLLAHAFQAREALGVRLPDVGHAWFLPYLFVYCAGAALLMRCAPNGFAAARERIERLPVSSVLIVLAICFVAADGVMAPRAPITQMLIDDVTGHVRALPSFVLGLFLAQRSRFWTHLQQAWKWLAPLAAGLFAAIACVATLKVVAPATPHVAYLSGLLSGTYGATMLLLVPALVSRLRFRPGPALAYLGDAVMPIYLMHQPAIILGALMIGRMGLPLWLEYSATFAFATALPLLVYHLAVRPCGPMRVAFGLKARPKECAVR